MKDDLKCTICNKKYSTKARLNLHIAKHKSVENTKVSNEEIKNIFVQVCQKTIEQNLYGSKIMEKIESMKTSCQDNEIETLCTKINEVYQKKTSFQSTFVESILLKWNDIFPSMEERSIKVILLKMCDYLDNRVSINENDEIFTKSLSEKELAGMQYLGGYVLHKLYKKIRNSKNFQADKSQQSASILLACKSDSNPSVKLVSALSRGGLWIINSTIQKIFMIAEKRFCTSTMKTTRTIQVEELVVGIVGFKYVKEYFSEIVESAELKPTTEVADITLYNIIKLYIKVRAYSFAKTKIQQYRLSKRKSSSKGLRGSIKQSLEKENT